MITDIIGKVIILLLYFFVGIVLGGWISSTYYKKIIAEHQVETDRIIQQQAQHTIQILTERDTVKQGAEEQHAKDQRTINDLRSSIYGLQVHIPVCGGTMSTTAEGNKDSSGGARLLSEKVDRAFEDLQRGVSDLAARCDQMNIDVIQNNNMVQ